MPHDPTLQVRVHGGADSGASIRLDFSTNANPLGPAPPVLTALELVSRESYPDPDYTALRKQLALWHHVMPEQILIAGSAGEWIWRFTHWLRDKHAFQRVWIPQPGYSEYQEAARRLGLCICPYQQISELMHQLTAHDLVWCCEPCNPTGQLSPPDMLASLIQQVQQNQAQLIIDLAYAPLQLEGEHFAENLNLPNVWRLMTPNKACALTGIRGAYCIAPPDTAQSAASLSGFAPSWVMGVDGCVLLAHFAHADTAEWLSQSRATLRNWRAAFVSKLKTLDWQIQPSNTHFMLLKPSISCSKLSLYLDELRKKGIKLRDAASFGLPGWVRMRTMSPEAQQTFIDNWQNIQEKN